MTEITCAVRPSTYANEVFNVWGKPFERGGYTQMTCIGVSQVNHLMTYAKPLREVL